MSTTHPQVGAYLDDLARMLADIDPGERDDILASVREHLDAEIRSGDGSDAVVHAALLRLGPPEQVAAAARTNAGSTDSARDTGSLALPDRSTTHLVRPALAPEGRPAGHTPGLIRVASVATALATMPGLLLMLWIKVTGLRQTPVPLVATGWPEEMSLFALNSFEAVLLMVLCLPVWLVGLGCAVASEGLQRRTRQRLIWAGPTGFFAVLVTLQPGGPSIVGAFAILVLTAAIAAVTLACRAAWREAEPSLVLG